MAGPSKQLLAALASHLGPVRAVLQDMEPNDVPVPVRKVAAYTGRRLPPPLLKSLVVELDRNEWLRTKVCDDAGDLDDVARAFLERPDGWWMQLTDTVASAVAAAPPEDLAPQVADLEHQLSEAKRRIGDLRHEQSETKADLKATRRQLRAHAEQSAAEARAVDLEGRLAALEAELATEQSLRIESEHRLEDIKRRRRKRRVKAEEGNGEARAAGIVDPVGAARRLDLQVAALAAAVRGQPVPDDDVVPGYAQQTSGPALPAGVAPDQVEAIEWLVNEAHPLPVIVDGYNVTFLLEPGGFTTAEARHRLVNELERFLRYARSAHRVLLVFDSSVAAEPKPEMSSGGVETFFATTAESADDEIVERVRSLDGRAVVITNDRELRERVGTLGALALWGTAFVDWSGAG